MEREDDEDYDGMDEGEDEEDEDYKPAVSSLWSFKPQKRVTNFTVFFRMARNPNASNSKRKHVYCKEQTKLYVAPTSFRIWSSNQRFDYCELTVVQSLV